MIRMNPQAVADLYGVDLIAFGTGNIGRRLIPLLAQDPNIRLHGVTNSRITADDEGTFLETGLPLRSLRAWAERMPDAVILVTPLSDFDRIIEACKATGFHEFRFLTAEMLSAMTRVEELLSESQTAKAFELMCRANELHDAHKAAFSEFKACHRGRTVAVVATGPSLSYYEQLAGAPHIGVNSSFLKKDLTLDYYFVTHYVPEWCAKLKDYDFVKFFNINGSLNCSDQFPEYILEENSGRRCFSMIDLPGTQVHSNIECYPLMSFHSIIFRAIHFALFTHPDKLLLVGCDCAATGHFDGSPYDDFVERIQIPQWIAGYRIVKKFVSLHYPDIEIVSVNPVGLKGMFRDVYTESYLNAHPEIKRSECEILNKENYGSAKGQ